MLYAVVTLIKFTSKVFVKAYSLTTIRFRSLYRIMRVYILIILLTNFSQNIIL